MIASFNANKVFRSYCIVCFMLYREIGMEIKYVTKTAFWIVLQLVLNNLNILCIIDVGNKKKSDQLNTKKNIS